MQKLVIDGGKKLYGEISISPAKNACLPIISSSILFDGKIILRPCPHIGDVIVMADIIKELGGEYTFDCDRLQLNCKNLKRFEGNKNTYEKARASFFTAGAIISRFGYAIIPLPGGCKIGERPVDIHLEALSALNIKCNIDNGYVFFDGRFKKSGKVRLRYPSVGATVNIINASVYTLGETILSNCAKEPEVKDLCDFLNKCGCNICGAGGDEIVINGVSPPSFDFVEYTPIYDRIEAGTYMFAVGACGGELAFECNDIKPIYAICDIMKNSGVKVCFCNNRVYISAVSRPKSLQVCADVYPAFPTDMQPQLCAYLSTAIGKSRVIDRVFPSRFAYWEQLRKFGAKGKKSRNAVIIDGMQSLNAAKVEIADLRGGAALLIAALKAEGVSEIYGLSILDRGYERLQEKLSGVGANIKRI